MNRFLLAPLLALSPTLSFALPLAGCSPQKAPVPLAQPATQTIDRAEASALSASSLSASSLPASLSSPSSPGVRQLSWSVERAFTHDTSAFTEGLLWKDGFLYESTGLEGQSSIRQVDLASGQVVKRFNLPREFFGEGLSYLNGQFFNLTWQNKTGFVFDSNFKPLSRFSYRNEGWGLTTDGEKLLQSDGTAALTWRSPKNFAVLSQIQVTRNGAPLRDLNELEWIKGKIWANVWQTNQIVIIDPQSGQVVSQLDLSGILRPEERSGQEDVLNGIAYDAQNDRIFVTGKNWPKLFWIRVDSITQK